MSDVFILGAGFSRAIGQNMPLMSELAERVFANVRLPHEKSFLSHFGNDIEVVMTYLAQDHPWLSDAENLRNRAVFLDLASAVREVLKECMSLTTASPCPEWLLHLITFWAEHRCGILTLNYDTLIESAARRCTSTYASGLWPSFYYPFPMQPADPDANLFSFPVWDERPAFTLYKLHGSINWLCSGNASVPGQTIYHAGLDDQWGGHIPPMPSHARAHSDRVPLIVPPVADKSAYFQHPQFRGMWSDAAFALRQATRIFFLGYSMPVTDKTMQFLLWRNRPQHKHKVLIVDVLDTAAHFKETLPAYAADIDGTYCRSGAPIPQLVEHLISQSPGAIEPMPMRAIGPLS